MKSMLLSLGLCSALVCAADAQAARFFDDRLSVNGFGTLGATYNHTDQAEFIRDISQQSGPAGEWSPHVDSRLGLQLGWRFTPEIDVVAQGVSRYNYKGNYDPQLTWAFLRYNPNPDLQIRLGRVALDMYMLADSRDVGYSYLWVRPPVGYYGVRHLSHMDGGDITVRRPLGEGLLWGKLYGGRADEKISSDIQDVVFDAAGSRIYGGHLNYELGNWRWQVGAAEIQYKLTPSSSYTRDIQQLENLAGLLSLNPRTAQNAAEVTALVAVLRELVAPFNMQITSAGIAYDRGPFQAQAMVGHMNRPGTAFDVQSAFVTFGYRLDPVTPYVTLSGARTKGIRIRDIGLNVPGSAGITQQTLSFGARYDVASNVALKTQLDIVNVDQNLLLWRSADPTWDGRTTVFSLNLDFVF